MGVALSAQQGKIGIQNGAFTDPSGDCFMPFGYNYVGEAAFPLLEDNWYADSVWQTIDEAFGDMKDFHANSVRIHLQYNRFMLDAQTPDPAAFNRLQQLVDLAGSHGLRLLVTGLGAYRPADQPAWYDNLDEAARWATQALFWSEVAATVGHSDAVFAYDLMNEPVMVDTTTWTPGPAIDGLQFAQNLTRTPNGRTFTQIVQQWTAQMTAAIRQHDTLTPITTGFVGCGFVEANSQGLDFISAHTYPRPDSIDVDLCSMRLSDLIAFVEMNRETSRPFIISEIAYLFTVAETDIFMQETCPLVNGWYNHYFGIRPEESDPNNFIQVLQAFNLEQFEAKYTALHQCQEACGGDVGCSQDSEPDPHLALSAPLSGSVVDESGHGYAISGVNTTPAAGADGQPGTALDFQPAVTGAWLGVEDAGPLQFRSDRSFSIVMHLYPRQAVYASLLAYDDKDNLDGDMPPVRDVVRLDINNTGLFDGQVGGDSVFYFTFTYGADNSTFLAQVERLETGCFVFEKWYTLTAVYDAGKDSSYLYVDGYLEDARAHQLNTGWHCTGQQILLGRNSAFAPFLSGYFNGVIDWVKLYDRALLPGELSACSGMPDHVGCTLVSAEVLEAAPALRVEPNPAAGQLWLRWAEGAPAPARAALFDANGRLLRCFFPENEQQQACLEVAELPRGLCWLQVTDTAGSTHVRTLVLQ